MMRTWNDYRRRMVSTEVTRPIIEYLRTTGVDLSGLKAATGLDSDAFTALDGSVFIENELRLWDWAAQATGDAHIGLTMAGGMQLNQLGLVGYLCLQQPTLRDLIATYSQFHRLLHQAATLAQGDQPGAETIEHYFSRDGMGPGRHANEMTLGSAWKVMSDLATRDLRLEAVDFQHDPPASLTFYHRFFGPQVKFSFNQPINRLVFPLHTFATPLKTPDESLAKILREQAQAALAMLPEPKGVEEQARGLIPELLVAGEATIDQVAARMGMSRRTFQRRLKGEGLVFRDILEQVRREMAIHYAHDPAITISEIGFFLGFSELPAFSRAFRRWTGVSPRDFRQRQAETTSGHLHQNR